MRVLVIRHKDLVTFPDHVPKRIPPKRFSVLALMTPIYSDLPSLEDESLKFILPFLLEVSETSFCFSAAFVFGSSLFPSSFLVEEGVGLYQG